MNTEHHDNSINVTNKGNVVIFTNNLDFQKFFQNQLEPQAWKIEFIIGIPSEQSRKNLVQFIRRRWQNPTIAKTNRIGMGNAYNETLNVLFVGSDPILRSKWIWKFTCVNAFMNEQQTYELLTGISDYLRKLSGFSIDCDGGGYENLTFHMNDRDGLISHSPSITTGRW